MTSTSAKRIVNKLSKYNTSVAIEALNMAVERDWTGVFPESIHRNSKSHSDQRLPEGV